MDVLGNIVIVDQLTPFAIALLFLVLAGLVIVIYWRIQKERSARTVEMKTQEETMSYTTHQLRSPITAVRGYASLILDEEYGSISETLKHPLDVIRRSSEQLAVIVEEYREFTRLESGTLELRREETNISEFIFEIVDELAISAQEKGHTLTFESDDERISSHIDRPRLRQVLHNIIENSIAYTPDGTDIYVHMGVVREKILVTISDSGPGIPEDEIESIFEKYKRGRHGISKGSGTGLGLYIARAIVRSHGGDIFASRSEQYGGASFQVEIPVRE